MFARLLCSCLSLQATASQAVDGPDLRTIDGFKPVNQVTSPSILQPGQILQIPKKAP